MLNPLLFSFFIFGFLFTSSALSAVKALSGRDAVQEFKLDSSSVKTLVPLGWEPVIGVLNTPLAILSKKGSQDLRTVIQVVPYGRKDTNDEFAKFKKDPEEFYAQKEEWLEGLDGESISYEPFTETAKDGATTRSIGIKYKNAMGEFLDKTYHLTTRGKELYYVKAVIPLDLEEEHLEQVNRVVASLAQQN